MHEAGWTEESWVPRGRPPPCLARSRRFVRSTGGHRARKRRLPRGGAVPGPGRVLPPGAEAGARSRVLPARGCPELVLRRGLAPPAALGDGSSGPAVPPGHPAQAADEPPAEARRVLRE